MRYAVLPGEGACRTCLQQQVIDTDRFMFRTGNPLNAVSANRTNPFFARALQAASKCGFAGGLSISKGSLSTRSARSTCRHVQTGSDEAVTSARYRAKKLPDFFTAARETDFISPVHATIGTFIDYDVSGLATAKSSGFMIRYSGSDSFTRPWGGHCENFNDATRLGILEGIERVACESPAPEQVAVDAEDFAETIGLEKFGIDIGPWKTAQPKVRAWTRGWALGEREPGFLGREVALPERLVYFAPTADTEPWVQDSSNGCAVGGTDSEAILFGLLEAVERDAFLAAWYGGLELSPIAPESIQNDVSNSYLQRLALNGVQVVLLDATVGIQIPTVVAVCEEPGGSTCVGAGCHPDPERALKSALIEVASDFQVVAAHREQRREELKAMLADYSLVRVMEDHADMFAHPDARGLISRWRHPRKRQISLDTLKRAGNADRSVESDLRFSIKQCREAGFEPIACELTDGLARAVGAHVWKVDVPGLIPIDFGRYQRVYSMSRLEDVARAFGDLPAGAKFQPVTIPHPFP